MSASDGARETDPLIGKVIQGRFRVLARVAAGGMGVVFKAEQIPLGRVVALKILESKQRPDVDESFSRRFFLEASAAAKLAHPNTIVVHDYGKTDEGLYFIAMEHLDGGSLGARLKKHGPLTPAQAIHVGLQVAGSLGDAHGQGLVHRDLKPGNVMFAPRGGDPYFVKVLDFGLVKVLGQGEDENLALTRSGVMMGSPRYMAPEQVKAQPVDHRADIYAFGAMLYHMVAGAPPFAAGSAFEAMHSHVHVQPPPLRATWPACPAGPSLEHLIMRCLAKEPAARVQSMHEVMLALRACQPEAGPLDAAASGWLGPAPPSVSSASMLAAGRDASASGADSNPSISRSGVSASRVSSRTVRFDAPADPPAAPLAADPSASSVMAAPRKRGLGLAVKVALGLVAALVLAAGVLGALWIVPRLEGPAPVTEARAPAPPAPPPPAPLAPDPPAPAAEPAPAAPEPAPITPLVLTTDPPAATVRREGRDLGDTPVPLLIPRGERWTIEVVKDGYVSRTVTVAGGQRSLTLHLAPEAPSRGARRRAARRRGPRPAVPTARPLAPASGRATPELDDPWARGR